MKDLKIDRTKLKTVTNYAKEAMVSRQQIHNRIKNKELKTVKIDGVIFIQL